MYMSKRRQRNFKRVREPTQTNQSSNPSKRHRERLNKELETVAELLPFDENTRQRLDKLSVLRLAVSFLQLKAHFQVCAAHFLHRPCPLHPHQEPGPPMGPVPTYLDLRTGTPFLDAAEASFSSITLKALGGFVIVFNTVGEALFVSDNIDLFIGTAQSDVLRQNVVELMIHSEDRPDLEKTLKPGGVDSLERVVVVRMRSALDHACGYTRVEIRGRFTELHPPNGAPQTSTVFVAVCTPFVPPIQIEHAVADPILKSKHSFNLNVVCLDSRLATILELDDNTANNVSFYELIHPGDAHCVAEAHAGVIKNTASGMMIYRLVGQVTGRITYLQCSFRAFFKNSKPESIGITHRTLTEVDGISLLEKRSTMKLTYLAFDETLLQSPRQISGAATLTSAKREIPEVKAQPISPQNDAEYQNLPLPVLPAPTRHLAPENSAFLPQPILQFPLESGANPDFHGLTAMFPGYIPVPERELFWTQSLRRSLDTGCSDISSYCNGQYPQYQGPQRLPAQSTSMILPSEPAFNPSYPAAAAAAYYQPPIPPPDIKLYEQPHLEGQEMPLFEYQQPRYPSEPVLNQLDPTIHAPPDFSQSTNNFTFFTEVAHTLLGNT